MPRFRPDGSINAIQFQRLKDKLGNRSNASSEVEFVGAYAMRVGEEGKGIRTIIQMVQLTRQDCAIASAGLMRSGLAHALHHARHRSVFQKHLADQPLMQAVLSDMALHVEAIDCAGDAAVPRLRPGAARSGRGRLHAAADARDQILGLQERAGRFSTRRWSASAATAMSRRAFWRGITAKSPVNAIWEGSGNVMCLDVLRALSREAEAAMRGAAAARRGRRRACPARARRSAFIGKAFRRPDGERVARLAVEKLALLAAAAALNKVSPRHAELFAATRLADEPRQHVRRGRSCHRRCARAAGAGAAVSGVASWPA